MARAARQAIGGPLRSGREKHRPAEHAGGGSRKNYLQVPQPGTARRDAHTDKKALRAGRPAGACGTRATPLKQGAAHGKRSRLGAFAAAATRARSATLGRTRFDRQRAFAVGVATARPEWTALAGALARRCAALRACWSMGKLDGQGHAAVLRDQLRNPGGLLANEHVQRELTSLDHVECLFPHGGGAGVSNRRRHGIDQRERRIRCTDGASLFTM